MANYGDRIQRLKNRRKGSTEQLRVASDSALNKSTITLENYALLEGVLNQTETWETRASVDSATRYVIGAMQSVNERYTEICIETAMRVENQIESRLSGLGYSLAFKLQGSVPLDIHIKGFSDVDLLVIDTQILRYASEGIRAGTYLPTTLDSRDIVRLLRNDCENELSKAFPKAHIDGEGSKSLRLTGGSLQREIDVVPAVWWDTKQYQLTNIETDRGVAILDNEKYVHIYNSPFVHINRIKAKCDISSGGLRKSIRMLKNIKADSEVEGQSIGISSYDIASIMYHADAACLRHNEYYELAVLGETQRWLNYLCNNHGYAKTLDVPNNTRKIFENDQQLIELRKLANAVDLLVNEILDENGHDVYNLGQNSINQLISRSSVF